MPKPLHVEPYDHPLRFLVESKSDPEKKHLVDLGLYKGNGKCACQHFEFRLEPELVRGSHGLRCDHIEAARTKFLDGIIAAMNHVDRPKGMIDREHASGHSGEGIQTHRGEEWEARERQER